MSNEGNEILRKILETGEAQSHAKDNYSRNYRSFQALFSRYSAADPLRIYEFIYAILNQAILLPITADTQDTALTIFSTLNDRGLPLSDADIFKAKIYNYLDDEKKEKFIGLWKELEEKAGDAGESIQQLFYYYMFHIRAIANDKNTTTPGVRKYFSVNKFERLHQPELMDNLAIILNVWKVVNSHEEIESEPWSRNVKIRQSLDALSSYPNEFWKYPVVIYYLSHRNKCGFENNFALFLNKLLLELLTKYLTTPTINAVKSDILKLNVEIINSDHPNFDFKDIDIVRIKDSIKTPHRNAVRMLLKVLAYDCQDELLPEKWEIEHIFPQKWQDSYFVNANDDMVREKIEHIGNKTPFEKRLNIIAGNGYFDKKKNEYAASKIAITEKISSIEKHDWNLDDISERDIRVSDAIMKILDGWNKQYLQHSGGMRSQADTPSTEDLIMIEKFKQNGWI